MSGRASPSGTSTADWGTNPGTQGARDAGCICPVMDNWRGNPEIGRIRGFVMFLGCPLHSPERGA